MPDFSAKSLSATGYIRSGPNAVAAPEQPEEKEEPAAPPSKRRHQGEEEEQVLFMANERFAGNELIFHPSDVGGYPPSCWLANPPGIQQMGLPETIAHVISTMPPELQGMFWAHIGIVGGLGNVQSLGERLWVLVLMSNLTQQGTGLACTVSCGLRHWHL